MGETIKLRKSILRPLFSVSLSRRKLYGFDVETHGKNNDFYMGGIYSKEGYKVFYDREEMMIEFITNNNYYGQTYVCATNLGFDFTTLFYDSRFWNDFEIIESGSRIIACIYTNKKTRKKITFVDTLNYHMASVAQLGKIIGMEKLETPQCILNDNIGYARKPKDEEERIELEIYNKRDCEVTYYFMEFLQENFYKIGGKMKLTIASTALDVYRRKYLRGRLYKEEFSLQNNFINDFIFDSYHGGRTEVFKRGLITNRKLYDINSLYPSVMIKEFPNPNTVRLSNYPMHHLLDFEGVSHVTLETNEDYYPLLPSKPETKLLFQNGTIRGVYTHVELRKAIELGYNVKKMHKTLWYRKTFFPFKEYIRDLYEKRMLYKQEGSSLELAYKILMNSTYGKFAQRHMTETKYFNKKFMSDDEIESLRNMENVFMSNDDNGKITTKKICDSTFVFPILSSYTTSYSRISLFEYLTKYRGEYCDTDSVITRKVIPQSKRLGKMKLEYEINKGILIKPKMYALNIPKTKKNPQGEVIKLKGVPKSILKKGKKHKLCREDFMKILNGEKIYYDKFSKLKESVKKNISPNSLLLVDKQISLNDTKRVWFERFNPELLGDSEPHIT